MIYSVTTSRGCRVERVPGFDCTRVLTLTVCAATLHLGFDPRYVFSMSSWIYGFFFWRSGALRFNCV